MISTWRTILRWLSLVARYSVLVVRCSWRQKSLIFKGYGDDEDVNIQMGFSG